MPNYTLIGYRPNSTYSIRGCQVDSSDSDLIILNSSSVEEIIQKWADLHVFNLTKEHHFDEYEISVLINGVRFSDWSDDGTYDQYIIIQERAMEISLVKLNKLKK